MLATPVAIQVFFFLCVSREKTGVVWDYGENVSHTIFFFAGLAWPHTILLLFCTPTKFLVKPSFSEGTITSKRGGCRTSYASFAFDHDADTMGCAEKREGALEVAEWKWRKGCVVHGPM